MKMKECDAEMEESGDDNKLIAETARISDNNFGVMVREEYGAALLSKCQTPAKKVEKKKALNELGDSILRNFGVQLTHQQILKKLNNMKMRVRQKTDKKKTGNKKILLNPGESIIFEMLGAEDNPTIVKYSNGFSVGTAEDVPQTSAFKDEFMLTEDLVEEPPTCSKYSQAKSIPVQKKNEMSVLELQQEVLLKQLEMFEQQKQFYSEASKVMAKIDRLADIKLLQCSSSNPQN